MENSEGGKAGKNIFGKDQWESRVQKFILFYIIQSQLLQMDSACLTLELIGFSKLPIVIAEEFQHKSLILGSIFTLQNSKVKLQIIEDLLILTEQSDTIWVLKLNFDVKFSMINSDEVIVKNTQTDIKSPLIGFDIINQRFGAKETFFHEDQPLLQNWFFALSKFISHMNFRKYFRPKKILGTGSFGKIFNVVYKVDSETFAAKAIKFNRMIKRAGDIKKIQNEIQILKMLQHRNILKIVSVYESNQTAYIVTENINGKNIFDRLRQCPSFFTEEMIRVILKEQLLALAYLDEKKIIHHDIKPANIMLRLDENNEFINSVLIDFGLSHRIGHPNSTLEECGTPGYIAPEFFKTHLENVSTKSDMFSLGVCLFQMIYKTQFFEGQQSLEKLVANKQMRHIQLAEENQNFMLIDLLKKMLKSNPNERISAMGALYHPYFNHREKVESSPAITEVEKIPKTKPISKKLRL